LLQIGRVNRVAVKLALGFLLALLAPFAGQAAKADPAALGRWSPAFDIGLSGVHATLLHSGEVLFFVYPHGGRGTQACLWSSRTGAVRQVPLPGRRNAFCGGNSVLPDGSVWVTGGTQWGAKVLFGAHETDFFDPKTRFWRHGPPMSFARWYPSNLTLPDGDVLVVSGEDENGQLVGQLERFSPSTRSIRVLPAQANRLLPDYPRLHLLPNGKVLVSGERADTWLFDPAASTWSPLSSFLYGDRYEGACVLLAGLERVLCLGGTHGTMTAGGDGIHPTDHPYGDEVPELPPTETAEILDLTQAQPAWRSTTPMHYARMHANAVLLPDGTVLVVGGGQHGRYEEPVRTSELFDPASETWTLLAEEHAPRMYHSTALLLPDGRVLSAGMDSGPTKTTAEIFSPPYLFRGPRPVIAAAPPPVSYGKDFEVRYSSTAGIARVTLMRPGSVTHSVDFEQRDVGLGFQAAGDVLRIRAPASGAVAPPGWYMLFIVDSRGVPSRAAWVHLA
jgi:hypothetical protein